MVTTLALTERWGIIGGFPAFEWQDLTCMLKKLLWLRVGRQTMGKQGQPEEGCLSSKGTSEGVRVQGLHPNGDTVVVRRG